VVTHGRKPRWFQTEIITWIEMISTNRFSASYDRNDKPVLHSSVYNVAHRPLSQSHQHTFLLFLLPSTCISTIPMEFLAPLDLDSAAGAIEMTAWEQLDAEFDLISWGPIELRRPLILPSLRAHLEKPKLLKTSSHGARRIYQIPAVWRN